MKILGVIPARGGSKGIPLKNIQLLNGKPLIEYSIESAVESGAFDIISISSDNDSIIEKCKKFEDIFIIKRPDIISQDESSTVECVIHACEVLKKEKSFTPDFVLTLEPTSPLRSKETIHKCIELLSKNKTDSVVSLSESYSCYGEIIDGKFKYFNPDQPRRRQERSPIFKESSTIYGTNYTSLIKYHSIIGKSITPLIVNDIESIDINEPIDLLYAETILKNKKLY